MEFLRKLFENGALSFDAFLQACQTNNMNLVNLSEGEYISKNKYTDELQGKDKTIKELKDTLKLRDNDIKDINKKLADALNDSEKLGTLQSDLDALQQKYDKDTKDFESRLSRQAYEFAVKEFANTQKFTSKAAKREFINSMVAKELKMDGDTIVGANDFAKAYRTENEDSFVVEDPNPKPQPPAPKFAGPTKTEEPPEPKNDNAFSFAFTGVRPQK